MLLLSSLLFSRMKTSFPHPVPALSSLQLASYYYVNNWCSLTNVGKTKLGKQILISVLVGINPTNFEIECKRNENKNDSTHFLKFSICKEINRFKGTICLVFVHFWLLLYCAYSFLICLFVNDPFCCAYILLDTLIVRH